MDELYDSLTAHVNSSYPDDDWISVARLFSAGENTRTFWQNIKKSNPIIKYCP